MSLLFKPLRPGWSWLEERIIFKHFTSRIIEVAKEENAESFMPMYLTESGFLPFEQRENLAFLSSMK